MDAAFSGASNQRRIAPPVNHSSTRKRFAVSHCGHTALKKQARTESDVLANLFEPSLVGRCGITVGLFSFVFIPIEAEPLGRDANNLGCFSHPREL